MCTRTIRQSLLKATTFYTRELAARGFSDIPHHLTEWNTDYERTPNDTALRLGAKGAALVSVLWIYQQQAEAMTASFFCCGGDTSLSLPTFYGLFYADGRPKPMALAYSLWGKFTRYVLDRKVQTASPLVALAAEDTAGQLALLLVNFSDRATDWKLELPQQSG
ncbi:MAG: hypothetical protein NZ558_14195 [Blastocatellia bacterium]|nr:hypothetical protein [Blastocatellia bacterium]